MQFGLPPNLLAGASTLLFFETQHDSWFHVKTS